QVVHYRPLPSVGRPPRTDHTLPLRRRPLAFARSASVGVSPSAHHLRLGRWCAGNGPSPRTFTTTPHRGHSTRRLGARGADSTRGRTMGGGATLNRSSYSGTAKPEPEQRRRAALLAF